VYPSSLSSEIIAIKITILLIFIGIATGIYREYKDGCREFGMIASGALVWGIGIPLITWGVSLLVYGVYWVFTG
jgi:hypothetical protein